MGKNLKDKMIGLAYPEAFSERTFQVASYILSRVKNTSGKIWKQISGSVARAEIVNYFMQDWLDLTPGTRMYEINAALSHLLHNGYLREVSGEDNVHKKFRSYSFTRQGIEVLS